MVSRAGKELSLSFQRYLVMRVLFVPKLGKYLARPTKNLAILNLASESTGQTYRGTCPNLPIEAASTPIP